MSNYQTPVFNALYKDIKTFGVSSKVFAIELATSGISLFVLHMPLILIIIAIFHITVAILNKKEKMWKEILIFLLKIPDENKAKLP